MSMCSNRKLAHRHVAKAIHQLTCIFICFLYIHIRMQDARFELQGVWNRIDHFTTLAPGL